MCILTDAPRVSLYIDYFQSLGVTCMLKLIDAYTILLLVRGVFRKYVDKAKIIQIYLDTCLYFILPYAEYQS